MGRSEDLLAFDNVKFMHMYSYTYIFKDNFFPFHFSREEEEMIRKARNGLRHKISAS